MNTKRYSVWMSLAESSIANTQDSIFCEARRSKQKRKRDRRESACNAKKFKAENLRIYRFENNDDKEHKTFD